MIPTGPKPHRGWHSRGYLPHFDSAQTVQHVVFRTLDSLPHTVMATMSGEALQRRRQIEAALDQGFGARPLLVGGHATAVEQSLLHFDAARYQLLAWCIMPNHVHVVVNQMPGFPLSGIVGSWKQFSARHINLASETKGAFWAEEYYDRFMRGEDHLNRAIGYVEQNPVAAGLASRAENWRFGSARRRLQEGCRSPPDDGALHPERAGKPALPGPGSAGFPARPFRHPGAIHEL